ncbi:MAG: methylated-DNA--[protein]-cysteine S-methyltransferase [Deltaproteobacteria bacterium]|nr:methylated-DNA--[protein]-cysteine S-methyltransferase [Deltaproteobacteria bacterium]
MSRYARVRTSLGTLAIGWGERGVSRILLPAADWHDLDPADVARAGLRSEMRPPRTIAKLAAALRAHLAGDVQNFAGVPLDTAGVPPFALRVLRAAQSIPAGQTRTYGELAALAGSPRAARAVGQAMAKNPWPIVVPCHRVFASHGFGEYSAGGGVQTKLRLLHREGYRGRTSNVLFDERDAAARLRAADPRLAWLIDRAGPFTLQAAAPRAMRSLSDEEIIVRFTRERGIARWNAQMLLIFHLGRPDVLPLSDPLLRRGFAITYGTRALPSTETIERAARVWSPYASVASWYLWRAAEIARYRATGRSA